MRNKNKTLFYSGLILLFFVVLTTCKKLEKSMLVSTGEVTNVSYNSSDAAGLVIDVGDGAIQHGHCYGTSPNVSTSGSETQLGTPPMGGFTSQLTNLTAGTKYYIKAYLSSGSETVYGKEISFTTTAAVVPTLTSADITSLTTNTATSGGNVTSDGGAPVTAKGVCWSTSTGPVVTGSKTTDGTGTGIFTSNLAGLAEGTSYFVRAYATNAAGTGYGTEISFSTVAVVLPTVTTAAVTNISSTFAQGGGNVTSDGGAPIINKGVCWSKNLNPTISDPQTNDGTGTGSYGNSMAPWNLQHFIMCVLMQPTPKGQLMGRI